MQWDLPTFVTIDGKNIEIEQECDFRVVLDCLVVYEDTSLSIEEQHLSALIIFYKNPQEINNLQAAVREMVRIIDGEYPENYERKEAHQNPQPPKVMSWKQDFKWIASAVSRILGYDVRTPKKYTHWWSLLGAFAEIGECPWTTIVAIRHKRMTGAKLEEWERKLYQENRLDVELVENLTEDEKEWLFSD